VKDEDPLVEEIQQERRNRRPAIAVAIFVIVAFAITFALLALAR